MIIYLRRTILVTAVLFASAGTVDARRIEIWSYQKLHDKSDLVAIATPAATSDTTERRKDISGLAQSAVGVETRFTVSAVLKGDKEIQTLVLHHYRDDGVLIPNGPSLVSFDPERKRTYLLFLVRENDGRYAPTFGQIDPAVCGISVLEGFAK